MTPPTGCCARRQGDDHLQLRPQRQPHRRRTKRLTTYAYDVSTGSPASRRRAGRASPSTYNGDGCARRGRGDDDDQLRLGRGGAAECRERWTTASGGRDSWAGAAGPGMTREVATYAHQTGWQHPPPPDAMGRTWRAAMRRYGAGGGDSDHVAVQVHRGAAGWRSGLTTRARYVDPVTGQFLTRILPGTKETAEPARLLVRRQQPSELNGSSSAPSASTATPTLATVSPP
jgi:hypothetical protein